MLNYGNLNDVEFEYLCLDIMRRMLDTELHMYARGADGGIDLCDNVITNNIVIQVKHYQQSPVSSLMASLKKEVTRVNSLNPNKYYICCSKILSPDKKREIFELFSDYMTSEDNIITLNEIEDFLTREDTADILQKHFKLWIDSATILQNLLNDELFVDCEALFSQIEKEEKLFVETQAYQQAMDCLQKNQTLFIIGNPGVGKTITSKMLVLAFAREGYRVRYTTNTSDLHSLKQSLLRNKQAKEIILIDDCFGQAYFNMRDTQSNELLSLIRYIKTTPDKLLVLNSRITIYKEAAEQNYELIKSINNKECKLHVLDMDQLSLVEKAKILYNHLYFNSISEEFFNEIKKSRRYRTILNHNSYNPRLIEYITNPDLVKDVRPKDYYDFILNHLNDPRDIWSNEYERRLGKVDRILLSTVFSFSDESTQIDYVKDAFNYRIIQEPDIDKTIDQFETSLVRLTEGFLIIVDRYDARHVMVANPSINDYLRNRIECNQAEKAQIIKNALYAEQLQRFLPKSDYFDQIEKKLCDGTYDELKFTEQGQRLSNAAYIIAERRVMNIRYKAVLENFFMNIQSLEFQGKYLVGASIIAQKLLRDPALRSFYSIEKIICKEDNLSWLFSPNELEDMIDLINSVNHLFVEENRWMLKKVAKTEIESAIEFFYDTADLAEFDPDINAALEEATTWTEYGEDFDEEKAVDILTEEIEALIESEIIELLEQLPEDFFRGETIKTSGCVSSYDVRCLVEAQLKSDYDDYKDHSFNEKSSEIDLVFERDYRH
ncbi:MAG: restriction endonuclease [Firmicutes bacterium]|nr:restriction endonuclease [Bacillota bacterium]